jgi:hypothetical protein
MQCRRVLSSFTSRGNVKEVTMTSQIFINRIGFVAGAAAIAIALFLTGIWVGSARGDEAEPESRAVPAWFEPIWDYYDRNPAVTPAFDFAALYAGETPEARTGRR